MIKFSAILTVEAALKAAEIDPNALRYVTNLELFIKVAAKPSIEIEVPEQSEACAS